jgi:hypothetical protein
MEKDSSVVLPHQFTQDGKVRILRNIAIDGTSRGGKFQNPIEVGATLTAPDWNPAPVCGGGIHGWPWGLALGNGKDPEYAAFWQVYECDPADVVAVEGGGKVKFRTGTLIYSGAWAGAFDAVLDGKIAWVQKSARGAASATGESGAASATGESGAASSTGERGAASATGWSGAASSTGWSGAASAMGWMGAASATGLSGAASATGVSSAAVVTGLHGKAMAGEFGMIALQWWNEKERRTEMRCALVGQGPKSLKAGIWYRLNDKGEFVEC